MSIVRTSHSKDRPYVILNKSTFEDKNLSWGAKGLWAFLLSKPDSWNVSVSHLSSIFEGRGGGEKAIYSLLNELIDNGYCERTQSRSEDGLFNQYEYIVFELKICLPHSLQGDAVERNAVKGGTSIYRSKVNNETTTEEPLVAVVFACLEQTSLSASEKQSVMKLGIPEPRVALAVEYATHPRTAIKKDLISTIVWHCKLEVPATPPEETAQEKDIAENKRQDELKEIIQYRRYKTREIIKRDWNLFHVKPNNRVDTVEFDNIKIYYSDKDFEKQILKAFAYSKKVQT